ncbi:DUF4099 domain-containing protein [Mucilaginibacter corticis]|uniref:DUF4099 domain-containing protein n=1 Tax=Mucilaginibacter corticis TaxID=2597670 RepID=A0A556MIM0_9SPHI|nr:DUF4099 domain-containing protein [Mucilaginibacter corticis]TSJ39702.1 DUF4099 domain-containing protein [Mucilaginibacter corticis]
MTRLFEEEDLPLEELQKVGLAENGKLNLDKEDMDAILSGRRTAMLRLENLSSDGFTIPALDAKVSLKPGADGELQLMLHPIYKDVQGPGWLSPEDADKLIRGEEVNLERTVFDDDGKLAEVLVEYDKETNEFIVTDTELVQAPDKINNEPLTQEQKEKFKKGKEVEMSDGTAVQFSAAEPKGIRSNRIHLMASILVDGGVSFVLYHTINAIVNRKQDKSAEVNNSKGFKAAQNEMQQQENKRSANSEQSRGYNRSRTSR